MHLGDSPEKVLHCTEGQQFCSAGQLRSVDWALDMDWVHDTIENVLHLIYPFKTKGIWEKW